MRQARSRRPPRTAQQAPLFPALPPGGEAVDRTCAALPRGAPRRGTPHRRSTHPRELPREGTVSSTACRRGRAGAGDPRADREPLCTKRDAARQGECPAQDKPFHEGVVLDQPEGCAVSEGTARQPCGHPSRTRGRQVRHCRAGVMLQGKISSQAAQVPVVARVGGIEPGGKLLKGAGSAALEIRVADQRRPAAEHRRGATCPGPRAHSPAPPRSPAGGARGSPSRVRSFSARHPAGKAARQGRSRLRRSRAASAGERRKRRIRGC